MNRCVPMDNFTILILGIVKMIAAPHRCVLKQTIFHWIVAAQYILHHIRTFAAHYICNADGLKSEQSQ